MRFANAAEQGLILGNGPIMKGQAVQSVESFKDLISDLQGKYSMKISGTPLWDPEIGSPFAILQEPGLLKKLPRVARHASVISGSIAAPFIEQVLQKCGSSDPVVPVPKEIACLISADDLRNLDLASLSDTIIIPGRAFVHDAELRDLVCSDGKSRVAVRGPEMLTADAETSMGMTRDEVLAMEMDGFAELIQTINRFGQLSE